DAAKAGGDLPFRPAGDAVGTELAEVELAARDRLGLLDLAVGTVGDDEHERPVGADGDAARLEARGQRGQAEEAAAQGPAGDLQQAGPGPVPEDGVDAARGRGPGGARQRAGGAPGGLL